MKEEQVQIETSYNATSPLLNEPFIGEVVAKFTNTAVLQITDYSEQDNLTVSALNYRITVKYTDLSMV